MRLTVLEPRRSTSGGSIHQPAKLAAGARVYLGSTRYGGAVSDLRRRSDDLALRFAVVGPFVELARRAEKFPDDSCGPDRWKNRAARGRDLTHYAQPCRAASSP